MVIIRLLLKNTGVGLKSQAKNHFDILRVWNTQNKFVYWYKSLKMQHINKFYEELRRCDDANPIYRDVEWGYNGIVQARGVEGYHQFINKLYNDAVDELTEISENEKVICKIRLERLKNYKSILMLPPEIC